MSDILTIGHSTHPIEKVLDLLRLHAVTAVADVRSVPASRFTPHFNRDALKRSLADAGIKYVFLGQSLGRAPTTAPATSMVGSSTTGLPGRRFR